MLKIGFLTHSSGYYELHCARIIKSLIGCQSLQSFEDNFKRDIKNVPKKHSLTAEMCFKLKWTADQYVNPDAHIQIWHVDIDGMPDNLTAVILTDKQLAVKP